MYCAQCIVCCEHADIHDREAQWMRGLARSAASKGTKGSVCVHGVIRTGEWQSRNVHIRLSICCQGQPRAGQGYGILHRDMECHILWSISLCCYNTFLFESFCNHGIKLCTLHVCFHLISTSTCILCIWKVLYVIFLHVSINNKVPLMHSTVHDMFVFILWT